MEKVEVIIALGTKVMIRGLSSGNTGEIVGRWESYGKICYRVRWFDVQSRLQEHWMYEEEFSVR